MFAFFGPTSQSKFTSPKRLGLFRTLVWIADCSYTIVRLNALSLYIYLQQPQTQTLLHLFVKTSFGLVFLFTHVNGNWCKKTLHFYWITAFLFSCLIYYCNRETVRLKTDPRKKNHTYQWPIGRRPLRSFLQKIHWGYLLPTQKGVIIYLPIIWE